jgi:tRNA threonylcarbamoyladenosine biosynthesis protein TsaB
VLILASEHSTETASFALLRDEKTAGARRWTADRSRPDRFWDELRDLLSSCSVAPSDIDCFAVGLGPGIYSGLRISLMALRGMALAGFKPVIGVSSGEAIAAAVFRSEPVATAVVVGDARRGRLWTGVFRRAAPRPAVVHDYRLIQPGELAAIAPPGSVLVSSDPQRTAALTDNAPLKDVVRLPDAVHPDAEDTAFLALARIRSGPVPEPGAPLRPIYLHPPVFVKPMR